MNENISKWNSHEFKVYLLLHAAHADFELKEEEKQKILSKATKTEYQHVYKVFKEDTDFERMETILLFREQFFPTEKDTEKIIQEIFELLNADEEFTLNEKNFFRIFKKTLKA